MPDVALEKEGELDLKKKKKISKYSMFIAITKIF